MSSPPTFEVASPYPQQGEVLEGKYRIEKLLGEGGMGAVAKATHVLRRAPVALKFMSPAVVAMAGAIDRFVNEGVAASQIDSDHVVKVFDVGKLPSGAPYLVMEFLEGRDLSDLLARAGGVLDAPRAVHFVLQILRGLHAAHEKNIIHRDMKPSNVFVVTKDGEADFVKLVDFGISKVRTEDGDGKSAALTRTNSALGTPLYMSAEQAKSPRDVDARSDLYSVGAILYELLSGRTPYTSETGEFTELLFKIFTQEVDPLGSLRPELPPGLVAAVHKALAREREQRFGSALEMAEALFPYADHRSSTVIARIQSTARGSMVPPTQRHSVTPAAPHSRVGAEEAMAKTFAGPTASEPPVKVSTDAAVVREAGKAPGPKGGSKAAPIAIASVSLVAVVAAAGLFLTRSHGAPPPAPPPVVAAPLPPTAQSPATGAEVATLAPPLPTTPVAPSASALPHLAPSASTGVKAPPRPSSTSSTERPHTLGNTANTLQ
jgi:serine/threonine-protein kinase